MTDRIALPEHILQFFDPAEAPEAEHDVSVAFQNLAIQIVNTVPRNPERTVALRKLLESKDAALRAMHAKGV